MRNQSKSHFRIIRTAAKGAAVFALVFAGLTIGIEGSAFADTVSSASTVASSPHSVAADGSTTSTVTVTLAGGGGATDSVTLAGTAVNLSSINGGATGASATVVASAGVATFHVADATPEAVTFQATDNTDGGQVITSTTTVTFLATVTFNANGGSGSLASQSESSTSALTPFSAGTMARLGYTFTGWNTALGGGGAAYADGASYPFTADVTLYAQWTQSITRDTTFPVDSEVSGNTSLSINPQHVGDIVIFMSQIHSQGITVTSVACSETGTWNLATRYVDSVNGTITEEIWWAVATGTGPTTVTATYSASIASLPVPPNLIADSFTPAVSSATWSVVNSAGSAGTSTPTIALPSLVSGSGATQLYWSYSESTGTAIVGSTAGFQYGTTAEGNLLAFDNSVAPNTTSSPTASQGAGDNFTAIAADFNAAVSHTVTFNANVGTGALGAQTSSVPANLSLFSSGTIARSGFSFAGWNTAADGSGVAIADGATFSFTGDATLYAQWTALANHTVTFNAGGGSGSLASETHNVATNLSLFSTGTIARSGYTFAGWNTALGGGGTAYADGASYPFTADVILYAQWTTITPVPPIAPVLPSLVVRATNMTVNYGAPVSPTSTISNLNAGDTASVVSAIYTYAGAGSTTYAASTTAPTAVGTYSVTPTAAVLTVTPGGHSIDYSPTYVYAPGTLTIAPLTLSVTAANLTAVAGTTITPSATVSGLATGDTASVASVTYTYAGTGATTYAVSTTAPTTAGSYSVTPSAASVTVTPSSNSTDYVTTYTYVAGTLTITAAPPVKRPLHAIRVIGRIVAGQVNPVLITGTGFEGQPIITSSVPGTIVRVYHDSGRLLTIKVTVKKGSPRGHHTFKITLASGKSCTVGYTSN